MNIFPTILINHTFMSIAKKPSASVKKSARKSAVSPSEHLMGSTVVGERGQVVIPKDIRDHVRLQAGDKLMVVVHKNGPIMLLSLEQMQSMMRQMSEHMSEMLSA